MRYNGNTIQCNTVQCNAMQMQMQTNDVSEFCAFAQSRTRKYNNRGRITTIILAKTDNDDDDPLGSKMNRP